MSSFVITEEEIEDKVAAGEINHEVYEEFLSLVSGRSVLDTDQAETVPENNASSADIDTS